MTHDRPVDAAALDWVIRQRDPDFVEWDAFTDWLEADPAHAAAYQEAAALDADLAALPPAPETVPEPVEEESGIVVALPRRRAQRLWLPAAIAASLVAVIGYQTLDKAPDSYRIETAMGETRTIALDDGSRIALNGGTVMTLSHDDPRRATLERGQALFHIVHRAEAPFRVTVGAAELVDIGTVFDVTRAGGETRLAVAEGAVAYNPARDNVRVGAGQRLVVREATLEADLMRVDPASVGGWSSGQLVYDGAPLAQVTAEITRTTGIRIRTAPDAAALTFRGALQTGTEEARLVSDLAALSGTHASRDAQGWVLAR
jgi:transmembrane sensor